MLSLTLRADLLAFRCAAVSENEPEDIALYRLDVLFRQVLSETQSETYKAFLTGKDNFRKQLDPNYKLHRKDKPKPVHLQACRDYLIKEYGAMVVDGYEADDAIGMEMHPSETICISIDKDLLQLPGTHYNFVKKEFKEVSDVDGVRSFYKQLLTGDSSDNIKGIDKIGPVKASKLLDHMTDEQEMFNTVRWLYKDDERFILNGKLLHIWRYFNDQWSNSKELLGESTCSM